jgi:hypothetical protein
MTITVERFAIVYSETVETVSADGPVRTHRINGLAQTTGGKVNESSSRAVLQSNKIPTLFSPHPEDPGATCRGRSAKQGNLSPNQWDVTLDYSTETPKAEDAPENPLEKRVIWSYVGNKITRIVDKDTDGKAVLNTAFDAPDPAIEVPATIPVWQAVANEANDPAQKKLDFEDKINSAEFRGMAAGTCRLAQLTATEETKNNITYWKVTYLFEYKRTGWQPKPLSQGFNQIIGGKKVRILDEKNVPVSVPWPLNIAGIAYDKAELEEGASFSYNVNAYYTANFSELGL